LGAARKTALEAATGDFVLNVDSDDYISLDAVEKLVMRQQETGADVVSSAEPPYDKQTCLRLMLIQHTLLPHIWGRLIRRSLFTDYGIASVEGINMAEDLALTPRLIHAAHTIAYIEDVTYYYRDDSSASTFATVSAKHVLSYVKANQELWTWFSQHDPSHTYLFALETGMLNVFHQALTVGFTKRQIADVLTYQPQQFLFRLLHRLLAHRQILPLLRLAYLSIKWYCKKTNHTLLRYYPER
jgi:glycosyltransferase involved in cell wall biosynthesis